MAGTKDDDARPTLDELIAEADERRVDAFAYLIAWASARTRDA